MLSFESLNQIYFLIEIFKWWFENGFLIKKRVSKKTRLFSFMNYKTLQSPRFYRKIKVEIETLPDIL